MILTQFVDNDLGMKDWFGDNAVMSILHPSYVRDIMFP